jgi:hypothetical protein
VSSLLETIYGSALTNAIRPPALHDQVNAFPRHPGTERYLHRDDPLLTPAVTSRFGTLASVIGYALWGAIALYGFLRLRNLRRFEAYYSEIGQIEKVAHGLEDDPAAPADVTTLRSHLEGQLTALKCRVLKDFAEGGLKGEGLMAGIIALINDTRGSLARIGAAPNGLPQNPADDELEHV